MSPGQLFAVALVMIHPLLALAFILSALSTYAGLVCGRIA